jgi:hypothetical protein
MTKLIVTFRNFPKVPKKQQGTSRFRPIFPKSVHSKSGQKMVCTIRKAGEELAYSKYQRPIHVSARSMVWVRGSSNTRIASSSPAVDMD